MVVLSGLLLGLGDDSLLLVKNVECAVGYHRHLHPRVLNVKHPSLFDHLEINRLRLHTKFTLFIDCSILCGPLLHLFVSLTDLLAEVIA